MICPLLFPYLVTSGITHGQLDNLYLVRWFSHLNLHFERVSQLSMFDYLRVGIIQTLVDIYIYRNKVGFVASFPTKKSRLAWDCCTVFWSSSTVPWSSRGFKSHGLTSHTGTRSYTRSFPLPFWPLTAPWRRWRMRRCGAFEDFEGEISWWNMMKQKVQKCLDMDMGPELWWNISTVYWLMKVVFPKKWYVPQLVNPGGLPIPGGFFRQRLETVGFTQCHKQTPKWGFV